MLWACAEAAKRRGAFCGPYSVSRIAAGRAASPVISSTASHGLGHVGGFGPRSDEPVAPRFWTLSLGSRWARCQVRAPKSSKTSQSDDAGLRAWPPIRLALPQAGRGSVGVRGRHPTARFRATASPYHPLFQPVTCDTPPIHFSSFALPRSIILPASADFLLLRSGGRSIACW